MPLRENLVVNNKDNRVLMPRNYRSDLPIGNLMFLKLAYLPSKLRFSGKYLFYEHQISAGQLSADSSSTETLYCLISVEWLVVVNKSVTFSRFAEVLKEHLETNE